MLGSPPDTDSNAVLDAVRGVQGVEDVHHVHLWQMQENEVALDCHVVLTEGGWGRIEAVKAEIKDTLKDGFGVTHSTLEFESIRDAHRNADLFGHEEATKSGEDHAHQN